MKGDWVFVPHNGSATHYGRVSGIYDGGAILTDLCYTKASALRPIPLTPEILEKNVERRTISGWYAIAKEVRIRPVNGEYCVVIGLTEIPVRILYVHELQHALRLCGIEKEIVL